MLVIVQNPQKQRITMDLEEAYLMLSALCFRGLLMPLAHIDVWRSGLVDAAIYINEAKGSAQWIITRSER